MTEVYTKRDIFEAMEDLLSEPRLKSEFMRSLATTKLHRLRLEYRDLRDLYDKEYVPIIDANINLDNKNYTVSQLMVNKINKASKRLVTLVKQIEAYQAKISISDWDENDLRTRKIFKQLFKNLDLKINGQTDINKYINKQT